MYSPPVYTGWKAVFRPPHLLRAAAGLAIYFLFLVLAAPSWSQAKHDDGSTGPDSGEAQEQDSGLTANALAAWVLERNPRLQAAQAAALAAAERIDFAGALDDPVLSYAAAPKTADAPDGLDQRIEVSQSFPWPGTLNARKDQARFQALAVERSRDLLRLEVAEAAKMAHAEWLYLARAHQVHQSSTELLRELISSAKARFAAGTGSRQDVLQARVELAELQKHKLQLQQLEDSVRARINALLHRPPQASIPAAAPSPPIPDLPDAPRLQAIALENHPALAMMKAEINARESDVILAEKAFYPDLKVSAGYQEMWADPDKRPHVGFSITVPLARGKRRAALDRAETLVQEAQWQLEDRRARLLADLTAARAQVLEAQANVTLYENELRPLVKDYLESAMSDYSSGQGSFFNVITAEQRLLRTELALARARADYARTIAALERWLGVGLPLSEGEQP